MGECATLGTVGAVESVVAFVGPGCGFVAIGDPGKYASVSSGIAAAVRAAGFDCQGGIRLFGRLNEEHV